MEKDTRLNKNVEKSFSNRFSIIYSKTIVRYKNRGYPAFKNLLILRAGILYIIFLIQLWKTLFDWQDPKVKYFSLNFVARFKGYDEWETNYPYKAVPVIALHSAVI